MREYFWGMLTMASAVAALFFLRYWRVTRERLFAFFALAFLALALNWILLAVANPAVERQSGAYLVRLLAFVLILLGILDRNRRGSRR